jgi:hypothetical protein
VEVETVELTAGRIVIVVILGVVIGLAIVQSR